MGIESRVYYCGYTIISVQSATVFGFRIEQDGKFISSRPNGALTAEDAITLGKEKIDMYRRLAG